MLYSTGQWDTRKSSYQELSFPNKKASLVRKFLPSHTVPPHFLVLSAWDATWQRGSGSHLVVLRTKATTNNARAKRREPSMLTTPLSSSSDSLIQEKDKPFIYSFTWLFFSFQIQLSPFSSCFLLFFKVVNIFWEWLSPSYLSLRFPSIYHSILQSTQLTSTVKLNTINSSENRLA